MKQLDKWNKEIQRIQDSSELVFRDKMLSSYRDLLIDVKKEMKAYIDNYENLSFSKKLEAERLLGVSDQIQDMIMKHYGDSKDQIEKYLFTEAEQGYYGTWYALEGAENIQLSMPLINQDYIEELMFSPIDGELFSKRLYKHTEKLGKSVTNALLRGTIKGEGYASVAKIVSEETEATYKRALRIARTEGGRIQSETKQRAYREAKRKGVDLEIQWMATLDKKTRHSHQELDGQIIPISGYFEFNGAKAKGPRLFGKASLDINCRCTTIAVVNGFSPELRKDNETKEIIAYKNYNDWLNKTKYNELSKQSSKNVANLKGIMDLIKPEHAVKVSDTLFQAPKKLRDVWNKFGDKIRLGDPDYQGGAHYLASVNGEGKVNMNMDKVINGTTYHAPMGTFFHEFGHNIDFLASKAKGGEGYFAYSSQFKSKKHSGYTLRDMLKAESNEYINKVWNELKDDAVASGLKRGDVRKYQAYSKVKKELMELDYYDSDVADIWEGVTNTKVTGKLGHGGNYWKSDENKLNKEAFAEMFGTAISRPESLEVIKKYFPKSHEIFDEMLDDILKE